MRYGYKNTGNLSKIGARIGDVVQLVHNGLRGRAGEVYIIDKDGNLINQDTRSHRGDVLGKPNTWVGHRYKIVVGPVVSETVIRKTFLEGTYGKVVVTKDSNGDWCFDARNLHGPEELKATIATLTELLTRWDDE